MDVDIFDVVLLKSTGISGYTVPVNSIAFKSVDYATYLDGRDAMNYAIDAPYGNESSNLSYENWIRFKVDLKCAFKKFLTPTGIDIPTGCRDKCTGEPCITTYNRIKNIKIWIDFDSSNSNIDITYGTSNTYRRPIRSKSDIALTSLKSIHNSNRGLFISDILFNGKSEFNIVDFEQAISKYAIFQLELFKGVRYQFANQTIKVKLTYDLD